MVTKKIFFVLIACVLLTGITTGCKGKEKTAKAETGKITGKVVIYTSMYEDIIEQIGKTLEKVFPDCDIEFFYGGTGTLQAKIAAEMTSNKLSCDMLMVAEPAYSLELKELGYLHPYKTPKAADLAFDYDPDGYWYPVRISNMILAYNPEKKNKADIPNSFYDFAFNPTAKGKISMSNPLTSGTAMASVTGLKDKYGYEYFTALGNQKVMVESGSVALTKLETGECDVIMILEESILKKRQEDDSKLEVIHPTDGTIVVPSTIMIVDSAKSANNNIAACEAVTEWFLSPEGQANIVSAWMHSVRKDAPSAPYDATPTADIRKNTLDVSWENVYQQREEIRTKFQEAVTSKK